MPLWVAPATVGVVALFTVCVVLIEAGVLKIAGRITFSEKFVGEVIRTKKNSLAALSMLTAPLVAVWTGVNPTRDRWIVYLFITMIVVAAILFIVHTLRGFIKQKVSLLVWFLYLCTVEIFPVYAATLAVIKNV